jgi:hypothetical protein
LPRVLIERERGEGRFERQRGKGKVSFHFSQKKSLKKKLNSHLQTFSCNLKKGFFVSFNPLFFPILKSAEFGDTP